MHNIFKKHLQRKQFIVSAFPIIKHVKSYNHGSAWLQDIIAGITVGLTLIPQSIAYAALAGLGPQYGLYSSLVGGIIYMIFGTIPELNIAPTALLSLLTYSYANDSKFGKENAATLLCFMSGIIELGCGLLHLGFLIDFVSTPVVAGFTSAAALTIAFAQLKNVLGLSFQAETMIDVLSNLFAQIANTRLWDAVLSFGCCVFLLGFRELKRFGKSPQQTAKSGNGGWKIFLWFLSVSRNAVVVVFCSVLAMIFKNNNQRPFSLTSEVEPGLPKFSVPLLNFNNGTHTTIDMLQELGSGLFIVPLIAIVSNVAIAKAFSNGKVVNASQEMIAVGLCNIIGSFFLSMPVNASFSRGAVSNASGVRTPISGLYTGFLVILALGFLTPYFSLIPKATLASVIICAVIFMVEIGTCKDIWKINKIDFIPLVLTFASCLVLGIEVGILLGIAVNLAMLLYFVARPTVALHSQNNTVTIQISASFLLYPSIEFIKDKITNEMFKMNKKDVDVIILDCGSISIIDFTSAKCLVSLMNDLTTENQTVVLYKLKTSLHNIVLRASDDKCTILPSKIELQQYLQEHKNTEVQPNKKIISVGYVNTNFVNDENVIQRTEV